ncbi:class I SAM-dependent methyltransferase [Streptomyces sp. B1866]|uniref:class I SAM-dependent methyltransferase n=1 Tax=Streptomyces sp. B1866 TaxID=3075431 RepID=UPI00288D9147|nr:class I SAM-dependent methyltransferase [Streptomyces sp. B1866]MDT3397610.1 class I SAM-dependent methyltransferase [Streptomyces sp. B1866]
MPFESAHFDTTGKITLDHIYTRPDPRAYFTTLRELDYRIPQLAKPYFLDVIEEYQARWRTPVPTVLDIGCSYGINAALLKCDATMDELYERYSTTEAHALTRDELLARDREFARSRDRLRGVRFIGLDVSHEALAYAFSAGLIDGAVHADLEENEPTPAQREQLAGADIVISTGCVGYVTDKTISRIVSAHGERKPWMAHFVLRMFPFAPFAESLDDAGYETVALDQVFKQRRFATPEEQSLVLDTLSDVGVDPRGLETEGWLYARLYVSRPRGTRRRATVDLGARSRHHTGP